MKKKQVKRLKLSKETLLSLNEKSLRDGDLMAIAGGSTMAYCNTMTCGWVYGCVEV